jgi:hypothetical protein
LHSDRYLGYYKNVKKSLIVKLVFLSVFLLNLLLGSPFVSKAYAVCSEGKDKNGNIITEQMIKNDPKQEEKIVKCLAINTAIGPVSTDPQAFVKKIFSVVLGLAGGIALILIIISGYKYMFSQGNPETIKGATEQLTSAIVGLLFIIFSFVILQIIGVDILKIPGFE